MTKQVRTFRNTLRRFERVHKTLLEERDCCSGLSLVRCHPLLELDAAGELSLNDLADRLGLSASTLSRTVEGLVRSELVDRNPGQSDRRYVVLSLTASGRTLCDEINRRNDLFYGEVLSRLPKGRKKEVLGLFQDLVQALEEAAREGEGNCCGDPE